MKAVDVLIQVNNLEKVPFVHHFIIKKLKIFLHISKGQKISEANCGDLNSSKKRNKKNIGLFSAIASKKWLYKKKLKLLHDIEYSLITVIMCLYFF